MKQLDLCWTASEGKELEAAVKMFYKTKHQQMRTESANFIPFFFFPIAF